MKKILGLAVLMMVMLISVSGLAVSDTTDLIPVYLNVPGFVSIEASPTGQEFELEFDPATQQATSDTVTLWAEANVSYTVNSTVTSAASSYDDWVNLLDISLSLYSGSAGTEEIVATAALDFSSILDTNGNGSTYDEILNLGTIPAGTKIADVTFTISQ